jgi:glycosyltransferase involved in cell wall biosynthesis
VLSVVTPAFNQASSIRETLGKMVERLDEQGLDYELIVVSDGSADGTYDRALELESPRIRVLDYDRNLGKGYALRTGSAAARGEYIAWVDSDLDLDPAALADFLRTARRERLDVVVGSKRHPDSEVDYPGRRRAYSWMYQQFVRALFQLSVRDTQVGMKLFRREVLTEVLPVVVVKRFAFDLEMLAVSRRFGFGRIAEHPIRLTYQFRGSGVNWRAIANALWDTAAVAYRLRVLRYYDRRRVQARRIAAYRPAVLPSLTVVVAPDAITPDVRACLLRLAATVPEGCRVLAVTREGAGEDLAAHGVEVVELPERRQSERLRHGASQAGTEVVAFVAPAARPAAGWATSALTFFGDPAVGAVVGPTVPLMGADARSDAGGILTESRLGVGGARARHHVGRLREIDDFPSTNLFVRTAALQRALDAGADLNEDLCGRLRRGQGLSSICSPDVVVTNRPTPLFRPYLRRIFRLGVDRGGRMTRGQMPRARHLAPVGLLVTAALGPAALLAGGVWAAVWLVAAAAYLLAIAGLLAVTFLLHRRARLALLVPAGAVASHVAFGAGFLLGALGRRGRAGAPAPVPAEAGEAEAR